MTRLVGDIYLAEKNGTLHFGNSVIELRFTANDGRFSGIAYQLRDVQITPEQIGLSAAVIRVDGQLSRDGRIRNGRRLNLVGAREIGNHAILSGYETICRENRVSLEITLSEDEWEITSIFTMEAGCGVIRRDIRLLYRGEEESVLRDVRLNLPVACFGRPDTDCMQAPDYPVVTDFPVAQMPCGLWPALDSENATSADRNQHGADAPGSLAGLVGLSSVKNQMCLMVWAHTTAESSLMEAYRVDEGVVLSQLHLLSDRFTHGKILEAGSQYFQLVDGSWQIAMTSFQRWYDEAGLAAPTDIPEWVTGTAIYEVHVGNAPFLGGISYEPYPHMRDLTRDLPRIRGMGFEVLQLMPHWPYCGYTVFRYEDIGVQYGNEEEFVEMTRQAHDLGLKVILDIVMHGPADREIVRMDMELFGSRYDFIFGQWLRLAEEKSIYRREHPEWFMRDEEGECAHTYTWAFDHAHPDFQRYFIGILKGYLRDFKIDGFRFDAPNWNSMPNWKRDLHDRASSSYYASVPLLCRVRNEIRSEFPDALLYTEPSGPIYRHCMDCTYNYDEEWLTGSLFTPVSPRGYAGTATYTGNRITARQAGRWLHFKHLALQRNAITIHHLDSHDTFWWGELAQFRHEAFKPEAAAAMFAVFALIGGGIMSYAGAEKYNEGFYARLLHLRQNMPELRFGECDFLSACCQDEDVLAVIRRHGEKCAIVAINLSDRNISTCIDFPYEAVSLKKGGLFTGIILLGDSKATVTKTCPPVTGEHAGLHLELPPYGVVIFKICPNQP